MWINCQPLVPLVVMVLLLPSLGCERQVEEFTIFGLDQEPLWVGGEDGYHTYRIPALLTTKQGSLLAFCEGRRNTRQDYGDIDLLVKRSTDGGKTWSSHQIVYEEGGTEAITIGNPSPVVDQDTGTIWMPFCRNNKEVLITKSTDDGLTWSEPVNISKDVVEFGWVWVATGPGVSIQLTRGSHKGRLVIPSDHGVMVGEQRIMHSHVFYSDDHGKTWQLGGLLPEHTARDPAAAEGFRPETQRPKCRKRSK